MEGDRERERKSLFVRQRMRDIEGEKVLTDKDCLLTGMRGPSFLKVSWPYHPASHLAFV